MQTFTEQESRSLPVAGLDLNMFGQRLRHARRSRGLTLAELGERVGRAPSVLSLLENGRREPKISLIEALAAALSGPAGERPGPAGAVAGRGPARSRLRRPRAAAAAGRRKGAE